MGHICDDMLFHPNQTFFLIKMIILHYFKEFRDILTIKKKRVWGPHRNFVKMFESK